MLNSLEVIPHAILEFALRDKDAKIEWARVNRENFD